MKNRLRKANRIVAVQEQMHRQAEWRLTQIARARADLERTREEIITTLNDDIFGPMLVEVVAKRLRATAEEAARLAVDEDRQTVRVREEALRLKRAEHMAEGVLQIHDQHVEKQMVAAILEGVASRLATEESADRTILADASLT